MSGGTAASTASIACVVRLLRAGRVVLSARARAGRSVFSALSPFSGFSALSPFAFVVLPAGLTAFVVLLALPAAAFGFAAFSLFSVFAMEVLAARPHAVATVVRG